jgi:hypothetical protein
MSTEWRQWQDLSLEKEEELINGLAEALVKRGLGLMGRMVLESGGSLTSMFAEFYMGLYGPFFDFFGVDQYVALLRNKRNVKKLIERIDELEEEREKEKNKKRKSKNISLE